MSTQQILKLLKQNKDNIVYQARYFIRGKGGPLAVVLINKTQMLQCKKLSSKFYLGKG